MPLAHEGADDGADQRHHHLQRRQVLGDLEAGAGFGHQAWSSRSTISTSSSSSMVR